MQVKLVFQQNTLKDTQVGDASNAPTVNNVKVNATATAHESTTQKILLFKKHSLMCSTIWFFIHKLYCFIEFC